MVYGLYEGYIFKAPYGVEYQDSPTERVLKEYTGELLVINKVRHGSQVYFYCRALETSLKKLYITDYNFNCYLISGELDYKSQINLEN
jgi:hypothetical protein